MTFDWNILKSHYTVRLIPNPRGTPELRAVAALLAMVKGVSEFGGRVSKRAGGPRYKDMRRYVECFTEVPFEVLSGETLPGHQAKRGTDVPKNKRLYCRPDGVILVRKGKQEWKALVEVKVGALKLENDPDQIAEYHKQASALGFDALITISNEPAQLGGLPPRGIEGIIDGRRARRCPVVHIQWRDLLGDAQALVDKGLEENVEDIDQAWMLTEWIRYVTDDTSGVLERATLGQHWSTILEDAGRSRMNRKSDELQDVVTCWIGYFGEIGYHLRLLGIQAVPKISRKERGDPEQLHRRLCDKCANDGVLHAAWKVPGPVDEMRCDLHLGHRKIHYSFEVSGFEGKTSSSRLWNWIGQLDRSRAPGDLSLTVSWKGTRTKSLFQLHEIESARSLQSHLQQQGVDRAAVPTSLVFEWIIPLPRKKGQHGVAHLEATTTGMIRFYEDIAAGLRSVERMPAIRLQPQVNHRLEAESPHDTPADSAESLTSTASMPVISPVEQKSSDYSGEIDQV
jgi:hypothetical protein